jgi:hypothetical protein
LVENLVLLVYLAWRVALERRGGLYTLWRITTCEGKPSYARVCLFYSLSFCIWYCPIEDCCIYSYEAHLNIKEEFILGFSLERVSLRKTLCLLFMLFTLLYIALTGYIHALWLMLLVI